MSGHTPEPWQYDPDQSETLIEYTDERGLTGMVAQVEGYSDEPYEANAQRIVACVNALAGIRDPEAFMAEWRAIKEEELDDHDFIDRVIDNLCLFPKDQS